MSSSQERAARTFVERHGLWNDEQFEAATRAERLIEEHGLEVVRLSFADQHGILRGKTLMAADAARAMRNGVAMTTTLLAKDTAQKTAFPVFTAGGGFGMSEMEGGADFLMIADPATFRVLPWAPKTGWVLCDIYFGNGQPVPFSTRHLYRKTLRTLADAGYDYMAGLEVEFHIFKLDDPRIEPEAATWPPEPPKVSLISPGYAYLTETRFDLMEPVLETVRREVLALGLPLRSVEVELGPSQCEFTFHPQVGLAPADTMMLFRSAVKQMCRRMGYHASFMCRPKVPNVMSSGWHLHQSLRDRRSGANAFVSDAEGLADRPAFPRRAPDACARRGGVHHADGQRLQALPRLCAGARPGDLGARQSRRDGAGAGRSGRSRDPAGKPHRRAGRQSLSLHGVADRHRAWTAWRASSIPARRPTRRTRPRRSCCRRAWARRSTRYARMPACARGSARSSSTTTCTSRRPSSRAISSK